MEHISQVDELVMEYLLFRGFTQAFRAFNAERSNDKTGGFSVDKILEQIFGHIKSYDIGGLLRLWAFLDARFFAHLDAEFACTVRHMQLSLQRCYVVHAIKTGKPAAAVEFFEDFADALTPGGGAQDDEWRSWFALPFLKAPQRDAQFAPFFARAWADTFALSLRNFLSLIFTNMPLPKLLGFNQSRLAQQTVQCELLAAEAEVQRLRREKAEVERRAATLRALTGTLQSHLQRFMRHATGGQLPAPPGTGTAAAGAGDAIASAGAPPAAADVYGALAASAEALQLGGSGYGGGGGGGGTGMAAQGLGADLASMRRVDAMLAADRRRRGGLESGGGGGGGNGAGGGSRGASGGAASPKPSPAGAGDASAGGGVAGDEMTPGGGLHSCGEALVAHSDAVTCCRFSPDGKHLATGGRDATVRIWTLGGESGGGGGASSDGPTTNSATCFCPSEILSMDWAASSHGANADQLLLFGTASRSIKMWSVREKRVKAEMTTDAAVSRVVDISCSPGGRGFVTALAPPYRYSRGASAGLGGGPGGALVVWDTRTGRPLQTMPIEPGPCTVNSVRLNHNGTLCVAGGSDGMVRLFDVRQATALMGWQTHADEVLGITFLPDETAVVAMGSGGQLQQWSLRQAGGEPEFRYRVDAPQEMPARTGLAFHEGGKCFLSSVGVGDGASLYSVRSAAWRVVSLASSSPLTPATHPPFETPQTKQADPIQRLPGHTSAVSAVDWHPSRFMCATASVDSTVRLWAK